MENIENPWIANMELEEPKVLTTCFECGVELYAGDVVIETQQGDYCSSRCLADAELERDTGGETCKCAYCDEPLWYEDIYIDRQDQTVYCSVECYMEDVDIYEKELEELED